MAQQSRPIRNPQSAIHNLSSVVVYSRHGCHLCDEAIALLERYGLTVDEVDVDGTETLRQRYDQCVPVVVVDGVERFRGGVNELLLRRLLSAAGRPNE